MSSVNIPEKYLMIVYKGHLGDGNDFSSPRLMFAQRKLSFVELLLEPIASVFTFEHQLFTNVFGLFARHFLAAGGWSIGLDVIPIGLLRQNVVRRNDFHCWIDQEEDENLAEASSGFIFELKGSHAMLINVRENHAASVLSDHVSEHLEDDKYFKSSKNIAKSTHLVQLIFILHSINGEHTTIVVLLIVRIFDRLAEVELRLGDVFHFVVVNSSGDYAFLVNSLDVPCSA